MAKRQVALAFPQDLLREPIIYTIGQQFNVVTNILQADIDVFERRGWIVLELEGEERDINEALAWATSKGVRVEPPE